MNKLIFLELNEVNFDFVRQYGRVGKLPALNRLIDEHGLSETTSEADYADWEPWIQWVTAHTGKTLAEHGIFRLGDITRSEHDQIWEKLEREGLSVGALSPMNATHRLKAPAFFLPDPWTQTAMTAPPLMSRLYAALAEAVNGNASGRLSVGAMAMILVGLARFARPANYFVYVTLALRSFRQPWLRAVFLDVLLGDLFLHLIEKKRPDFATAFFNSAAHIQHHYMFSSDIYEGEARNPAWYVPPGADPVLASYETYDRLVQAIRKRWPTARVMIATGLHQVPHERDTYYWRLKHHEAFLKDAGVPHVRVEPLMSRDFVVVCDSPTHALEAEHQLGALRADDGRNLFTVDNRGADLFVELTYDGDIGADAGWRVGNLARTGLREQVAFVAIKNGEHDGVGYFIDSAATVGEETRFPLAEMPEKIIAACLPTRADGLREAA